MSRGRFKYEPPGSKFALSLMKIRAIIDELFDLYGNAVPSDTNELHSSVREFIEIRAKRETSKSDATATAPS